MNVSAQFLLAKDIQKQSNETSIVNRTVTLGYIMAVYDLTHNTKVYCMPKGVNTLRIKDIVVKYINDTPSSVETPAAIVIQDALAKAWPCVEITPVPK